MQCPAQLPSKEEPTVSHLCQVSNHRWHLLLLDLQRETWAIIYIYIYISAYYLEATMAWQVGKMLFVTKYLFPWKSGRTCTSSVKAATKGRFCSTIIVSNILFRSSNTETSGILKHKELGLRHLSKSNLLIQKFIMFQIKGKKKKKLTLGSSSICK